MMPKIKILSSYLVLFIFITEVQQSYGAETQSKCFGTTSNGRLENGVKLLNEGKNFITYGSLPSSLGRTYVHSKVRDIIIESYGNLVHLTPGVVYKYAETGNENGGPFSPHKTHQNGLSVDFMVPVKNQNGDSIHLPSNALNRYGYDVEFDSRGQADGLTIDFESLGAHIVELHRSAIKNGAGIWRVIFAPDLQPLLYSTQYGEYIRKNIKIPTKKSWVRHDEHIHVDFAIPCEK